MRFFTGHKKILKYSIREDFWFRKYKILFVDVIVYWNLTIKHWREQKRHKKVSRVEFSRKIYKTYIIRKNSLHLYPTPLNFLKKYSNVSTRMFQSRSIDPIRFRNKRICYKANLLSNTLSIFTIIRYSVWRQTSLAKNFHSNIFMHNAFCELISVQLFYRLNEFYNEKFISSGLLLDLIPIVLRPVLHQRLEKMARSWGDQGEGTLMNFKKFY